MTFELLWDTLKDPNTTIDNAIPEVAGIIRLMDSDKEPILNSEDVPDLLAMVWAKRLKDAGVTQKQISDELTYRDGRGDAEGELCECGWDDVLYSYSLAELYSIADAWDKAA